MSIPNFQIHRKKISANSAAGCGNTGDDPKASACWRQLPVAGQPIHWSERGSFSFVPCFAWSRRFGPCPGSCISNTYLCGSYCRRKCNEDSHIPADSFLNRIVNICESVYPGPKVLMINYPHNPTATLADLDLFKEIVMLAKKFNFMVIHDFAYSKITFDGNIAPSFLEVSGAKDVGVEFGSFSKSYNMAGWRIGYCVGNSEIIEGLGEIKGYFAKAEIVELDNLQNISRIPPCLSIQI